MPTVITPPTDRPEPIAELDVAIPFVEIALIAPHTDRKLPWPLEAVPPRVAKDREAGLAAHADDQESANLLITLLAEHYDAREALARLRKYHLSTTENVDRLAATFGAFGRRDQGRLASVATSEVDITIATPAHCERVLAWGAILDAPKLSGLVDLDGQCGDRTRAVLCALRRAALPDTSMGAKLVGIRECYNVWPEEPIEARSWLVVALSQWPAQSDEEWLAVARDATHAIELPGVEIVPLIAIENAAVLCHDDAMVQPIHDAADKLAASPHHDRAFDARLARIRTVTCR
jgi:hypothetical protein